MALVPNLRHQFLCRLDAVVVRLPLLEDPQGALGLLHHPEHAVQHLDTTLPFMKSVVVAHLCLSVR